MVTAMTAISIRAPNVDDAAIAARLLEIQHAAYRVEADLIGYDGIPQLGETVNDLQTQPINWLAAFDDGTIVGAVGFVPGPDGSCDIDRLVVDPSRTRRGIGRALVEVLLDRPLVTVSTGARNEPACALYESLGFHRTGEREVAPGITVVEFARPNPFLRGSAIGNRI
jgi:ribosomal protein S18 acetylase RimI-like enzyme